MPHFAVDPFQAALQAAFQQGVSVALDPDARLQAGFPGLRPGAYKIIGGPDGKYNCIAWAAGERDRHWWPGAAPQSYWPPNIPPYPTLDAFTQLFRSLGYEICTSDAFERRFEKIAIFADSSGVQHAARQRGNGRWSSKAGQWELFEHDLRAVECAVYGTVVQIMQRKRTLGRMVWEAIYFLAEPRVS
jgi:hypothetical protein